MPDFVGIGIPDPKGINNSFENRKRPLHERVQEKDIIKFINSLLKDAGVNPEKIIKYSLIN